MTSAIFFNIENIAGSAYMNLMLTGIVRYISGGILSALEIKCPKAGRKAIHFGTLVLVSTCLMTFVVVIATGRRKRTYRSKEGIYFPNKNCSFGTSLFYSYFRSWLPRKNGASHPSFS
jgi:hypothetical protein